MRRRASKIVIPIKGEAELNLMRRAGRIVALSLAKVSEALKPGVTTGELDAIAEKTIRGMGATPSFLGYRGYPATACISLNDEVVHGIPGARVIHDGDLVSIDLGAIVEGFHADSAWTFSVGTVGEDLQRLMLAGQDALVAGIAAAIPGHRVRDIGAAVQRLAESRGYTVVRDLCGHGVGRSLHEDPQIPNYWVASADSVLKSGMTLAIEPMVNAGTEEVKMMPDHWTFVTRDGLPSVHYEHTVLVTQDGPEIFTTLR